MLIKLYLQNTNCSVFSQKKEFALEFYLKCDEIMKVAKKKKNVEDNCCDYHLETISYKINN